MTRGFHSKKATFSIRNYFTGALLYFTRKCQDGRETVVQEELYQETSKFAEGFSSGTAFLRSQRGRYERRGALAGRRLIFSQISQKSVPKNKSYDLWGARWSTTS